MSDTIKAIVALGDDVNRYAIEAVLEGGGTLEVVEYSEAVGDVQEFLAQPSDIVIVACGEYSERTTELVDRAVKQRPDRPVVVLAQGSPNGRLRQAFEAGADDVLALPQSAEGIRFALEKVIARRHGSVQVKGTPSAPLICVLGPKGGTGKTLVSANLAVALAQRGRKVVLVDLDLQFGDVGLSLGLVPERTIYDLAKAGQPYDHDKLDRHLMRHSSGVKVLVGPTRPDHAGAITVDFLRDVYASLRTMCDVVIVDTSPSFTAEVIATIDVSTAACLVGMLDALSLKNTKLGIETLDLMGYPPDRVSLVLNRADSRVGITQADVTAILGRDPDILIPSDREIPRSVNEGTPIVGSREKSEAAKAFRDLADRYTPKSVQKSKETVPAASSERRSMLSRRRK
jgi:pilus assembly protein CpaE